jgi:methanol metabolism-related c-type cytochrome
MAARHVVVAVMLAGPFVVGASLAFADGSGDPAAVKNEGGKSYDKEGNPTFKVQSDGTLDWSTYSGFRRYHSDCHVCHGPDGEGSSYAPALSHVLKTMNYPDFANVVVNGRKNVNTAQESVMPSFGTNRTSCATSRTYSSICGRAPMMRFRAEDRKSMKRQTRGGDPGRTQELSRAAARHQAEARQKLNVKNRPK